MAQAALRWPPRNVLNELYAFFSRSATVRDMGVSRKLLHKPHKNKRTNERSRRYGLFFRIVKVCLLDRIAGIAFVATHVQLLFSVWTYTWDP